jgi:cytochrome c oxidase subunit III
MATQNHQSSVSHLETSTLEGKNKILGFWLFLGGESVLFGVLFATFIGLRNQVGDGPAASEIFNLALIALATLILLVSSLTSVLAIQAMHRKSMSGMLLWFTVTVVLGFAFLLLEIYEFYHYVHEFKFGFTVSPFASSYYTLVGFHGAHVAFGVAWIALLILQLKKKGLTAVTAPKLYVASLYWHFIDVVWVFIFTVVYLMGKVA